MTPKEYQEKTLSTLVTSGLSDTLAMSGLGLAGEAGECADIIKKALFHKNKPIDEDKLADELGDVMWYLSIIAYCIDVPLETIMERNIAKLQARHASGQATANGGTFNSRYPSDSVPEA